MSVQIAEQTYKHGDHVYVSFDGEVIEYSTNGGDDFPYLVKGLNDQRFWCPTHELTAETLCGHPYPAGTPVMVVIPCIVIYPVTIDGNSCAYKVRRSGHDPLDARYCVPASLLSPA